MQFSKQRGFTLVELLVVIGIIGILVAILIPAVNMATGIARKNTCLSNQRNWAKAMLQHASASEKGYFPGYVNRVRANDGATEFEVSWMIKLFPYVEQGNLWNEILDDPTMIINADPRDPRLINIAIATCPSDPAEVQLRARSSFVANTGIWDGEASDNFHDIKANGICHDLRKSNRNRMDLAFVSNNDGTTNTILLSENVNAFTWFSTEETLNGMIWTLAPWIKSESRNDQPRGHSQIYAINRGVDYGSDAILMSATGASGEDWLKFARPSSRHSGGVNVMFCGENGRFLSEDIDWTVYKRLLTVVEAESRHPHGDELSEEQRRRLTLPLSTEDMEP